jgi:oligopeptide transport system substrate-binding protein
MNKRFALTAALLATVLCFLAAQGSPAPTEEPDFVVSIADEAVLDPSLMDDVDSTNLGVALFEGLMQYDPETNLGVPALAESHSTSPDGLTVTFKLRKASWSDGHPVTAGDFVYAMERLLDPRTGANNSYFPALILKGAAEFNEGKASFDEVGIKALDDQTLQYSLKKPAPWFVDMTCGPAFWPLPRWAIEKSGKRWTRPANIVTNGPYRLAEWWVGDYLLLERDPAWHDAAAVTLRAIKVMTGGKDKDRWDAYSSGSVDWMRGYPTDWIKTLASRSDQHHTKEFGTAFFVLNFRAAPTALLNVRKALSAAIDRAGLIDKVLGGGQFPSGALVPPMPGYEARKGSGFNPVEARRYLAEAGYPGGRGFPTLVYLYNDTEGNRAVAEYAAEQWKRVLGLKVELRPREDYEAYMEERGTATDYLAARGGWIGDYLDPDTFLGLFESGSPDNDGGYSNPAYDKLVRDARTASGPARMALLEEAEAILLADVAVIPLYHYGYLELIDTAAWGGWFESPFGIHPLQSLYRKATAAQAPCPAGAPFTVAHP